MHSQVMGREALDLPLVVGQLVSSSAQAERAGVREFRHQVEKSKLVHDEASRARLCGQRMKAVQEHPDRQAFEVIATGLAAGVAGACRQVRGN